MIKGEAANVSADEVLETAGILDGGSQNLRSDGKFDVTSAAAPPAALQNLNLERAGLLDHEIPTHPIIAPRPITEGIFVRLRFITDCGPVSEGVTGVQKNS